MLSHILIGVDSGPATRDSRVPGKPLGVLVEGVLVEEV